MNNINKHLKIILIASLVLVITVIHYSGIHGQLMLHNIHRELYFIPILLASFWFGMTWGLITSVAVSLMYAPHVLFIKPQSTFLLLFFQISIFNLVAVLLGWLVDRQKREQKEKLAVENIAVLGRVASAVGHEMKSLLGALKRMAERAKGLKSLELDRDFKEEMKRLQQMVDILSSFGPDESIELFSHDLNKIIRERLDYYQKSVRTAGLNLKANLDDCGCPSRVNTDTIGWILDQIIKNAMEVSARGQTIHIRSRLTGSHCEVQIKDEGPGIRPEHLPKMFTPFFTTKKRGQGLALAACRKALRDMGGDIQVTSTWGEGATFTLTIPREYSGKPLATDPIATVIKGEKVRRIYRD